MLVGREKERERGRLGVKARFRVMSFFGSWQHSRKGEKFMTIL